MDPIALASFVSRELALRADPANAGPMAAYLKTDMPFHGVKKPGREEVLREVKARFVPSTRTELEAGIRALWALPHREEKYLAIAYARRFSKLLTPASLPLIETLVREGAWWDLVDDVAANLLGSLWRRFPEAIAPLMDRWIEDDDLWIRRAAVLGQLKRKEATDTERLLRFCRLRMHEREFFMRKAIGWALRQHSYVDPELVITFLQEHRDELSGLSFREGAKALRRRGLFPGS